MRREEGLEERYCRRRDVSGRICFPVVCIAQRPLRLRSMIFPLCFLKCLFNFHYICRFAFGLKPTFNYLLIITHVHCQYHNQRFLLVYVKEKVKLWRSIYGPPQFFIVLYTVFLQLFIPQHFKTRTAPCYYSVFSLALVFCSWRWIYHDYICFWWSETQLISSDWRLHAVVCHSKCQSGLSGCNRHLIMSNLNPLATCSF